MIGSQVNVFPLLARPINVSNRAASDAAQLPEREVIRRAKLGDCSAFECIYRAHCGRVFALCSRMLGNRAEAEDLTQETFLTVLRKIHTFRGESSLYTWLHRIAVNSVLMRLRQKIRPQMFTQASGEHDDRSNDLDEHLAAPDLLLSGSLDRLSLERALNRLAPRQKMVVELHDIQGYKHHEIAKILDWSIGTSKAQLHRARKKLRTLLGEGVPLKWVNPLQHARVSPDGV